MHLHLLSDIAPTAGAGAFLVLAIALALSFEFVNGFHDTANAVATVIYTHTLKPPYRRRLVGHAGISSACSPPPAPWPTASWRCCPSNWCSTSARARALRWSSRCSSRPSSGTRHLVPRPAGLQFAHADRLDHGRRPGELAACSRSCLRRGRQLGQGAGGRSLAAVSPMVGFVCAGALLLLLEAADQEARALYQRARRKPAAAALDPRLC